MDEYVNFATSLPPNGQLPTLTFIALILGLGKGGVPGLATIATAATVLTGTFFIFHTFLHFAHTYLVFTSIFSIPENTNSTTNYNWWIRICCCIDGKTDQNRLLLVSLFNIMQAKSYHTPTYLLSLSLHIRYQY